MRPLTDGAGAAAERGGGACVVPPPFAAAENDVTMEIQVIFEITEGEFFQELIRGIEHQASQVRTGHNGETNTVQISIFDAQGTTYYIYFKSNWYAAEGKIYVYWYGYHSV